MHIPSHYRTGGRKWGENWSLSFKSLNRHNPKPAPGPRTWDKLRYFHQTHFAKMTLAPDKHQRERSIKGTHWREHVEGRWLTALLLAWGADSFQQENASSGSSRTAAVQDNQAWEWGHISNAMTPALSFTLLEPQLPFLSCVVLDSHSRAARRKLLSLKS